MTSEEKTMRKTIYETNYDRLVKLGLFLKTMQYPANVAVVRWQV